MATPENREAASIPAVGRGFTVAASPFNGSKPELAMVGWLKLVLSVTVGFAGMAWLTHRIRRVRARQLLLTARAGAAGWPGLR